MTAYLCGTLDPEAAALGVAATEQHIGRGWNAADPPRVVPVRDNCTPLWAQAVRDACAAWNAAQGWVAFAPKAGTPDVRERVPGAVVIRTTQTPFPYNGIAENLYAGGAIASSVITLDESNYLDHETGRNRYPYPARGERLWLVAHELGHALGLPHPSGAWATAPGRGIMGHEHDPADLTGAWARALLAAYYAGDRDDRPRRKKRRQRR